MKFTDKFVLVPTERYERLMKQKLPNKIETLQTVTKTKPNQIGGFQDKKIEEEEEEEEEQGREGNTISKTKEQTNKEYRNEEKPKLAKNFKKTKKNVSIIDKEKIPPRPPGIPNKIKKSDFRWLTLTKR